MSERTLTLAKMTAIQLEGLANSLEIGQKLWHNRNRIKDAYLRDQRYDSIGHSLAYCPWNVCLMDETKTHAHLHRGAGLCEWTGCDRTEVHIHKFKPPPPSDPIQDTDPTGRYERVKDILKELLGEQYREEPLTKNIYLMLEDERKAEEAEKEREMTHVVDAERAGEEAKREFEEAAAEQRARRADDRKKAREVDESLERKRLERRAAKAKLISEAEAGNELERTFTDPVFSSSPTQSPADVQPQASHPHRYQNQIIESDDSIVEANAILGKRKRANSPLSQVPSSPYSSPTDAKVTEAKELIDEEARSNTKSPSAKSSKLEADSDLETSDLTPYTLDQLDAILDGAEIVRYHPNSLPLYAQEVVESAPYIVIDREQVSNNRDAQVATAVSSASADEEIQLQNGYFVGSMPPVPSPPRQKELSGEEIEMEEQLARRKQIQWVLKSPKYKDGQRKKWEAINIYEDTEDTEDTIDDVI